MSRNRSVPPLEPRRCAWCGEPMSERRPPTLVRTKYATFVGPYHAGCAERLKLAYERGDLDGDPPGREYGHDWTRAREEDLPW